ncbi:DUF2064 domain-containing protein [Spirosoma sp. SC4-14]|uniref:DUF2064 domain-containing protein n=1 Tax=Spirosoma sp. SC4-14 TaxID=3128900 RepID=UPI0030CD5ED7
MCTQRVQTAVLLFSLPAPLAASHKRLANGNSQKHKLKRSRTLWTYMHQLALAKTQAAQLPCIQSAAILSEAELNAPFGEQLQKAIYRTLHLGYKQLIIIGNDCPGLTIGDLRNAANELANGKLPIGGDQRGGVFLFGIDDRFLRDAPPELFAKLPWQTPLLGKTLTAFLKRFFGELYQLSAVRTDWNNPADLGSGIDKNGAFSWLTAHILAIISRYLLVVSIPVLPFFSYRIAHFYGLRAPPL